jgi:membrane associated rhomboid family serine protease
MRLLSTPRTWFVLAAVLAIVALFVLGGAPGGVVAAAAAASFIFGAFLSLRRDPPEDRTAGTGMFGGF